MTASSHSQGNPASLPIFKKARKAHKWLMALVGVQFFIWAMTGAYMVFPNIHYIHGDHLIKQTMPNLAASNVKVSFNHVLKLYPTATNVRLGWLGDRAIYRFSYVNQDTQLIAQLMLDANLGKDIRPLQLDDVVNLFPALLSATEVTESLIDSAILLDSDSDDYPTEIGSRGLPLWQIQLNTWDNTRFYISQYTGEVTYVRHHAWRLFDLFWRLHIMDYIDGDEPENWLLAITSVVSLCAILAGFLMLYFKMASALRNKQANLTSQNPSAKTPLRAMAKKSHKWLALIVFVQLSLWVGSGFLLARIDHSLATGQLTKLAKPAIAQISVIEAQQLANISVVLAKMEHVESVDLVSVLKQWVFRVQHKRGRHAYLQSDFTLLDAKTGSIVEITQEIASQLALATYNDEGLAETVKVIGAALYETDAPELPQEQNVAWQISVNDALNTKIMLNAQTGDLIAHVNDKTPLRNLLFTLHFMDYANEGSFNNAFIKLFALLTLLLSFTGMYWLFELVKNKQFVFPSGLLFLSRGKNVFITIKYVNQSSNGQTESQYEIRVNSNLTILDGLTEKGFTLKSECAGGGLCGKCICQLSTETKATTADNQQLTEEQLAQKFRLACQHRISSVKGIILHR